MSSITPTSNSSVVASQSTTSICSEKLGITAKLESLKGFEQGIPAPFDEKCMETHVKEKEGSPPQLLTLAKHVFHKLSQKEKTKWSPTPIQLQTWPILNQGLNLMAIATTGSGKTLSYAIPMVHSCMGKGSTGDRPCVHGLVLVPTRELAIQVFKVLKVVCKSANKLSGKNDIIPLAIYGGVDKEEQIDSLLKRRDGIATHFLIATTPMRMIDILGINIGNEKRSPNERVRALFERTKYFVIDEADRLGSQFDLTQQTQGILDFVKTKSSCLDQYCLFSATLPQKALSQCNEWVSLPRVTVKVNTVRVGTKLPDGDAVKEGKDTVLAVDEKAQEGNEGKEERAAKRRGPLDLSTIPAHITQTLHVCSNHKKPKKLCATIKKVRDDEKKDGNRRRKGLIIIFFGRIKTLQYMHKLLLKEGVQGIAFHSQMNQQKREDQLNLFRCGKCPILLATDIAARGLHVSNVEYIINYDFPGSLEQVSLFSSFTFEVICI